jgi:PAS domain-containing protein
MSDGVVLLDERSDVQHADSAAARLLGTTTTDAAVVETTQAFMPPSLRRLAAAARSDASVREEELEIGRPPRRRFRSAMSGFPGS